MGEKATAPTVSIMNEFARVIWRQYLCFCLTRIWLCPALGLSSLSVCLSIFLSVCLSIYVFLPLYLSVCLSLCMSVCMSVSLGVSVCLRVCLSSCRTVCLFVCISACQYICIYVYIFVCLSVFVSYARKMSTVLLTHLNEGKFQKNLSAFKLSDLKLLYNA